MEYLESLFDMLGLRSLTLQAIGLRILLATLFGGVLGLERSHKGRAAGFRTYILVCVSSCVIMMTGQYMQATYGGTDPARLGAQIVSGIGFLGAGSIIVTGTRQIRGLTTAAGLWSSACMGIAIGIGFYVGAVLMCIVLISVLTIFDMFEKRYVARSKTMHLYVVLESIQNITDFLRIAEESNFTVDNYDTTRPEYDAGIGVFFSLHFKERLSHREILEKVRHCPGLLFAEER